MRYTLDSLVHVEQALKQKYPSYKIDSVPVIKSGAELAELVENPLLAYFGVLTVPPGITAKLTWRGNETMTVEPGSQIIEAFTQCLFVDDTGVAVEPKGFFRGFEIQVQF